MHHSHLHPSLSFPFLRTEHLIIIGQSQIDLSGTTAVSLEFVSVGGAAADAVVAAVTGDSASFGVVVMVGGGGVVTLPLLVATGGSGMDMTVDAAARIDMRRSSEVSIMALTEKLRITLVPSTRAEKFNSEVSIMTRAEELRSRWCHQRARRSLTAKYR